MGCSKAVCTKNKSKALWEKCPEAANEDQIKNIKEDLENVKESLQQDMRNFKDDIMGQLKEIIDELKKEGEGCLHLV